MVDWYEGWAAEQEQQGDAITPAYVAERMRSNRSGSDSPVDPNWTQPWVLFGLDMIPWVWVLIQVDEVVLGQSIMSEWFFTLLTLVIVGVSKFFRSYLVTHVYER